MKKTILLCLTIMLAFTGGCGMSKEQGNGNANQESLPETEALKDEFTKKFIQSDKEIEDGYYLFNSQTKKYNFLFPINAKLTVSDYEVNEDDFESLSFGERKEQEDMGINGKITFDTGSSASDIESALQLLANRNGYEGAFEERTMNDYSIYEALHIDTIEGQEFFVNMVYIKHPSKSEAIQFIYEGTCLNENQCKFNEKSFMESKEKILNSIRFTSK
ncbi:hypothetical protein WKH31_09280 [Metabacillus indicus]|uniref:hypothetical protein n=1 Tax=Metabacillus indicus TaxID=246786 RepID=UPI003180489E